MTENTDQIPAGARTQRMWKVEYVTSGGIEGKTFIPTFGGAASAKNIFHADNPRSVATSVTEATAEEIEREQTDFPRPDTCKRCGLGIASHGKGWPLAKLTIPGVRDVPEHRFIPSDSTARLDRSTYSREDLLAEISDAEIILDSMGAKPGMTLWGRIGSIKPSVLSGNEKV